MKTTPTQRAAAEQAICYRVAWIQQHRHAMCGTVLALVQKLERVAGPVAMADALAAWEANL